MRSLLNIIFTILLFCLYSCEVDTDLNFALKLAGDNRKELETVLQYYSTDKKDSLKFEAVKFLISNMPIYYSFEGKNLDNFKHNFISAIGNGYMGKDALNEVQKTVGLPILNQLTKVKDIEVIKAEYIIDNIEHSFKVWEEQPWGKYITFEVFCEYILPYRIENEPLENWKEKYYQHYQPILDSLLIGDNVLDACNIIYNHLVKDSWSFILEMPEPHLGANFLFDKRIGSCRDRCDLAIYVMRSLGIPVGTDMVLQSPDQANRHFWSFVLDNNGRTVEFTLWEEPPIPNYNTELEKKRGKVYRNDYSYKKEQVKLMKKEKSIPGLLSKTNLKDVSDQYFKANEIYFDKNEINNKNDNEVLYLCVFDINGWLPVAWGNISKRSLLLKNIEDNVLYSLCSFQEERMEPIYYPFIINKNNSKEYFIPSSEKQSIYLERKYTMKFMNEHMKRFTGGVFEASSNPYFIPSEVLYTIDSIAHPKFYSIDLQINEPYRYIRYFSPDNSLCNMAELIFFDEKGKEIIGEVIGSEGSIFNEERLNKYAVFDKDPLTFFNAPELAGMWVGMDFKQSKKITKIIFLPRNDDNFIKEGEEYELFYADRSEWKSLGTKIGTSSQVLIYENVPKDALFWLRNLTKGKEERPFSYENNKQKWW